MEMEMEMEMEIEMEIEIEIEMEVEVEGIRLRHIRPAYTYQSILWFAADLLFRVCANSVFNSRPCRLRRPPLHRFAVPLPSKEGRLTAGSDEIETEVEGICLWHIRPAYTHKSILVFAADLFFRVCANSVFNSRSCRLRRPPLHRFAVPLPSKEGRLTAGSDEIETEVEGICLRHIRPAHTYQSILVFAADLLFRSSANFVCNSRACRLRRPPLHRFAVPLPSKEGRLTAGSDEIEAEVEGIRLRHIRPAHTYQSILVFAADLLFRVCANSVFNSRACRLRRPPFHRFAVPLPSKEGRNNYGGAAESQFSSLKSQFFLFAAS
jgi:hypothetical protein